MTEEMDDPYIGSALRDLGERIRQARLERGLTVRDMVIKHNYHDAQWRRYEKGGSLTVPSLLRIAKALRTSLSLLLDGVGEPSNERNSPPQSAKLPQVKNRKTAPAARKFE